MADERGILIRNEQAKLTASYLSGVAIATAAIGGVSSWVAGGEGGSASLSRTFVPVSRWPYISLHDGSFDVWWCDGSLANA